MTSNGRWRWWHSLRIPNHPTRQQADNKAVTKGARHGMKLAIQ